MTTNPARWHRDPSGRHQLRYWNGTAWTEHVSDHNVTSRDPLAPGESPSTVMPSSEGRSTPASHEPTSAVLDSEPRRTQPTRPAPTKRPARATRPRPRRSTAPRTPAGTWKRPTPIVTEAGWSTRAKLLVASIALAALVGVLVISLAAG